MLAARAGACAGGAYAAAPTYASAGGDVVAAVRLVGAWDASNVWRRSALLARLDWCVALAAADSPCDLRRLVTADGVQWAWAGWFDADAFIIAADAGGGNATRAGWTSVVPVEPGCGGVV